MPPPPLPTNFTGLDWGIVIVYLAVSVAIGLFVRRYVTSMTAFVVAGRAVSTWLGLATIIGTEMGLITIMYAAEAGFKAGFSAFHIPLILAIMVAAVGIPGLGIVPLRRMGVLTIPEFYGRRFGQANDYGHWDLILGRNASEEVWPDVIRWLRNDEPDDT